jgi:hypothetical protein
MDEGSQSWHQGGADDYHGKAGDGPAELYPRTGLLRRGGAPSRLARPTVARPMPTTVLWRWRYEVGVLAGAPLLWWSCVRVVGGLTGLSVVTGLLAVVALLPPLRRWAFAVLWGVITPHRIRVGCAEAGVVSPRGKLPAVVFTRRKPYGERVYLWCPEGMSPIDVAAARPALAAACWAREVNFYETAGQYPPLVVVEVVRQPAAVGENDIRPVPSLWARFELHGGQFEGFEPLG